MTILSRCLQFNLKNMSPERVAEHLKFVLGEENIPFEEAALWQLGRAADGSMRDALSLTDQAIAFGESSVMEADVSNMLGSIDRGRIQQIFEALMQKDAAAVLNQITELAEFSPDFSAVLEELISLLHRIAVVQVVPDSAEGEDALAQKLRDYAEQISAEDLQLYYQIALIGRRDLPLNPSPKAGLEMILLRMLAFSPVDGEQPEAPKKKLTTNPNPGNNGQRAAPSVSATSTPARSTTNTPQAVPTSSGAANKASQALAMARGEISAKPTSQNDTATQAKAAGRARLDLVVDNDAAGLAEIAAIPTKADFDEQGYEELAARESSRSSSEKPESNIEVKTDVTPKQPVAENKQAPKSTNPGSSADTGAPTVQPQSTAPVAERFPLEQLNSNEAWIEVVHQSPLRGMTRNILMQCGFESRADKQLNLKIDPQYIDLLNVSHHSRIEQALTETLSAAIKVNIQAGEVTQETPAAWAQRVLGERLQAAREALENDPNVQHWMAEFGATLDVDSIKPID
ncbi:DNA polymerase III subunits gamma and tau [gamma proteobacterium IMCC2047]|nr:DNA polymerase III subunits gamma and tau [gamma proteobacterium IMCC2047]